MSDSKDNAWPDEMPVDLKLRIMDALSYSHVVPEDVWDEVREWLVGHKVRAAENLDTEKSEPGLEGSRKYSV